MLAFLQQPLLFLQGLVKLVLAGRLATRNRGDLSTTMVVALGALGADDKLSHHRS